jgi:hypothetical protein
MQAKSEKEDLLPADVLVGWFRMQDEKGKVMNFGERVEQLLNGYWAPKTLRRFTRQDEAGECPIGRILSPYGQADLPTWPKLIVSTV